MSHYIICCISLFLLVQASAMANPQKSNVHTHSNVVNQSTTPLSLAKKNLILGQAFLQTNQSKPGIYTLPSGLQYKIIHEGSGTPPGPTDFVTVNYRGTLIDGTEFDSSYAHNAPATFAVNAVIPGWSEALQLMKPDSKWTIYIPSKLAYGEPGAGRLIGPNATLIFDIELIAVKPALHENQDGFDEEIDEDG